MKNFRKFSQIKDTKAYSSFKGNSSFLKTSWEYSLSEGNKIWCECYFWAFTVEICFLGLICYGGWFVLNGNGQRATAVQYCAFLLLWKIYMFDLFLFETLILYYFESTILESLKLPRAHPQRGSKRKRAIATCVADEWNFNSGPIQTWKRRLLRWQHHLAKFLYISY